MSDDRKRRVEELFHAALDEPPQRRSAFLAARCGDDPVVLAEVQSLLEHDHAGTEDLVPEVTIQTNEIAAGTSSRG